MSPQPIAVFDSGLGGLTVVRALRRHLPHESVIYFGDTARVPYGNKSSPTVEQFAAQNCRFLLRFDPKVVVVACNTASALALEGLRRRFDVPLVGVVEPGAAEAVRQARRGGVAVLATEATVASEAYPKAIRAIDPTLPVIQQQCPSLVALIEEGRSAEDPILLMLLGEYLEGVSCWDARTTRWWPTRFGNSCRRRSSSIPPRPPPARSKIGSPRRAPCGVPASPVDSIAT